MHVVVVEFSVVFFFQQKTAYEWRISDWSSDVCSSDLSPAGQAFTTAMQEAVKNRTGRIVPPAQHAAAINRYMTSATGRKESVRSGILRPVLAKEMGLFMQQAQPKIDARMRAAMSAAS